MALEDFVDPEVGIAVAATALVASPRARGAVRQGLVYGLAGVFKLGDMLSSGARNVAQSAQQATSSAGATASDITAQAQTEAQTEPRGRAGGRAPRATTANE